LINGFANTQKEESNPMKKAIKVTTSPTQAAKPAEKENRDLSPRPCPLARTNLTEDQKLYCDLAADLLTCGGPPRLFERFFDVLTQYEYERQTRTRNIDPNERPKKRGNTPARITPGMLS
jgi:hypothetical protein